MTPDTHSTIRDSDHTSSTLKLIISVVLVYICSLAVDLILNSYLFADLYRSSTAMWRSRGEMLDFFPFGQVAPLLISFLFVKAYIYYARNIHNPANNAHAGPWTQSLIFGLWFGITVSAIDLMCFMILPLPRLLLLCWVAADILKFVLAALLLKPRYFRSSVKSPPA